jgi:hypothetical protein
MLYREQRGQNLYVGFPRKWWAARTITPREALNKSPLARR